MSQLAQYSEAEVLSRTRTFAPPPADLDPITARHELLVRHGYPRRPDPATEPRLARLWTRAAARRPQMIQAELALDRVLTGRDRRRAAGGDDFQPGGWGGVVVQTASLGYNPPEPANNVYARWTVPGIWAPSGAKDDLVMGIWVGLDGYGNGQVLQAGIAATVTPESHVTWWAWTEWYPFGAVQVTNFIVDPGDVMTVLVCAPRADHGFASIYNETTNQATSIGIDPPAGTTSLGATAEWAVEGISDELPVFCPVTFGGCVAGTKHHTFHLKPDGFTTEISGDAGPLTSSAISDTMTAVVQWEGAS